MLIVNRDVSIHLYIFPCQQFSPQQKAACEHKCADEDRSEGWTRVNSQKHWGRQETVDTGNVQSLTIHMDRQKCVFTYSTETGFNLCQPLFEIWVLLNFSCTRLKCKLSVEYQYMIFLVQVMLRRIERICLTFF